MQSMQSVWQMTQLCGRGGMTHESQKGLQRQCSADNAQSAMEGRNVVYLENSLKKFMKGNKNRQ